MSQQNWYLLTGAPSTGKTTAFERVHELFVDLMKVNERMGYENYPTIVTLPEMARQLLEQPTHPEVGTQEFENMVAQMQIASEQRLVQNVPFESYVVFADRTMLDVYAYSIVNGLDSPISFDELHAWMARYDHVFVFATKNSVYHEDGVRGLDDDRQRIEDEILATVLALKIPFTLLDGHISKRYMELATHVRKDIDEIFMGSSTQRRNVMIQRENPMQQMVQQMMEQGHGPGTD